MRRVTFYIYKNIDNRELRYFLHKLENLKNIDVDKLKKAIELRKVHKKSLTLTKQEEEIVKRLGKSANLLLNYVLVKADEGERT